MTDRTTPKEASRAAFEAWMKGNYAASWGEWYLMKTPAGEYVYSEGEWDAWQAATQARDAECAALRDALKQLLWVIDNPADTDSAVAMERELRQINAARVFLDPQQ